MPTPTPEMIKLYTGYTEALSRATTDVEGFAAVNAFAAEARELDGWKDLSLSDVITLSTSVAASQILARSHITTAVSEDVKVLYREYGDALRFIKSPIEGLKLTMDFMNALHGREDLKDVSTDAIMKMLAESAVFEEDAKHANATDI